MKKNNSFHSVIFDMQEEVIVIVFDISLLLILMININCLIWVRFEHEYISYGMLRGFKA